MPYSSLIFDNEIAQLLSVVKPVRFLDVGSGAGKYGQMVRSIFPEIHTIGIEIEKDYIDKFQLKDIYSEVWNISAMELIAPKFYENTFDVVMVGDVIEHLRKSDGIDLINYLIYRSKWLVVQFPHKYLQNSVDGYNSEAHISVWGENDFSIFEATKLYKKENQRLIVLKGYLDDGANISDIEYIFNE